VRSSGRWWVPKQVAIFDDTGDSFDQEPSQQLEPNHYYRVPIPRQSALRLLLSSGVHLPLLRAVALSMVGSKEIRQLILATFLSSASGWKFRREHPAN
jgi:hypothetical protein